MAQVKYTYKKTKFGYRCTAVVTLSCTCVLTVSAESWDKSIALFECKKLVTQRSDQHRC